MLRYLDEHGGRAPSREVVEAVGATLADRLTARDRQQLKSGGIRWEKRAAFVRLRLVERGELATNSPRGTWEITDKGRERLLSHDR
jgi:restriction system protein